MSERRVQVPEGMLAATEGSYWSYQVEARRELLRRALQWLVANPQVPTEEECDDLWYHACLSGAYPERRVKYLLDAFQRRFLFAPAEPEYKFNGPHLLTAQDGTQARCAGNPKQCAWCAREDEAYRRGQQSMIKKEKQP